MLFLTLSVVLVKGKTAVVVVSVVLPEFPPKSAPLSQAVQPKASPPEAVIVTAVKLRPSK